MVVVHSQFGCPTARVLQTVPGFGGHEPFFMARRAWSQTECRLLQPNLSYCVSQERCDEY